MDVPPETPILKSGQRGCRERPAPPGPPTGDHDERPCPNRRPGRVDRHVQHLPLPRRLKALVPFVRCRVQGRDEPCTREQPPAGVVHPRAPRRPCHEHGHHRVLRHVPPLPDHRPGHGNGLVPDPGHQPTQEGRQETRRPLGRQGIGGAPEDQRRPRDGGDGPKQRAFAIKHAACKHAGRARSILPGPVVCPTAPGTDAGSLAP